MTNGIERSASDDCDTSSLGQRPAPRFDSWNCKLANFHQPHSEQRIQLGLTPSITDLVTRPICSSSSPASPRRLFTRESCLSAALWREARESSGARGRSTLLKCFCFAFTRQE